MNRLKQLRKEGGYSLRELDSLTGISYSSLSHLENGSFNFTEENIRTLSAFFSVSADYLLGISEVRNILEFEKDKEPLDDFQFALYGEVKELTDEQKTDILEMVKTMKEILMKKGK